MSVVMCVLCETGDIIADDSGREVSVLFRVGVCQQLDWRSEHVDSSVLP